MRNRTVSLVLAILLVCAFLPNGLLSALASGNLIQMLVEPTMDYFIVGNFSEGLARVEENGKCGFIDMTGELVIPLAYDADRYSDFSEELALVYKGGQYMAASQRIMEGGKCGFIDRTGKVVIPLKYDGATAFSEGLAAVEKGGKQYLINRNGETVVALDTCYSNDMMGSSFSSIGISSFSEGLAAVEKDGQYGFIDKTGKEVIPLGKYESAWRPFSDGLTAVRKDGQYGFIDKAGEVVIPFVYGWANSFSDGLAAVSKNKKYGVINKSGEVIIPFEYDNIGPFSEGLMSFEKDGARGYMDETGKVIISLDYQQTDISFSSGPLLPFRNGFAVVNSMLLEEDPRAGIMDMSAYEKWGVIDKTGKEVIPPVYDYISDFDEGVAVVFVGFADFYHNHFVGNWGVLQIEGWVAPPLPENAAPVIVPPLSENSMATPILWLLFGLIPVIVILIIWWIVRKQKKPAHSPFE
ncbi:MAG: WG repeat-containing protein [Clostridiales bacterium]|nr:WG repeat-containing protein [Clostridiales bacterium]